MDRDFMSVIAGKEAKGSRHDAGLAVQWPFTIKAPSMEQFMSFKAAEEDKRNMFGFDQSSSSNFRPVQVIDSFGVNHSKSPAPAKQKSFNIEDYQSQSIDIFGASSHQMSETRTFPVASHHSIPTATNSPFFKFNCTQNSPRFTITTSNQQPFGRVALNDPVVNFNVETLTPRNVPELSPMSSQLTIFYAGAVHVYDDVPVDKAHAIITLASKGSNANLSSPRSETPFTVRAPVSAKFPTSDGFSSKQILNPIPIRVVSPCSRLTNPIPSISKEVINSRNGLSTKSDSTVTNVVSSLAPSIKQEPCMALSSALGSASTATAMRMAVPQARKASLARFLEKRKERMNYAMPYSITRISDAGSGLESTNASSISSSPDVNFSCNRSDSWGLVHPKYNMDTGEFPSTKLEI